MVPIMAQRRRKNESRKWQNPLLGQTLFVQGAPNINIEYGMGGGVTLHGKYLKTGKQQNRFIQINLLDV